MKAFLKEKPHAWYWLPRVFLKPERTGEGKITPIEMGIMSNVDKPGRGQTSSSTAQARGGAWMKIWVSWPQVKLHNLCMLPPLHPDPMCPLCHYSQRSGCEGRCGQAPLGHRVGSGCVEQAWPASRYWAAFMWIQVSGPGSLQLCSVALRLTPRAQLDPGWVPAPAAAHTRTVSCAIRLPCCVARSLGMWWNASGSTQRAVRSSLYESVAGVPYFYSFILHSATSLCSLCYCPL